MEEKTFTHCRSSWRPCFQDSWLLSDPEDSFSLASSGEEEDTNQQRVQLWCDLQARWECSSLATSGQLHRFGAWLLSASTQRLRVNGQEDRFLLNCRSKQQQLSPRLWLHQWLSVEICLIPVGWGFALFTAITHGVFLDEQTKHWLFHEVFWQLGGRWPLLL